MTHLHEVKLVLLSLLQTGLETWQARRGGFVTHLIRELAGAAEKQILIFAALTLIIPLYPVLPADRTVIEQAQREIRLS